VAGRVGWRKQGGQPPTKQNGTTMNRWIALFRGINVGGKNLLPMATLMALASEV